MVIMREYLLEDYHDIFHLESRMGNWHSNITQETAPGLIEFVFVNSRKVLELLQSPFLYERKIRFCIRESSMNIGRFSSI